MSMKQQHRAHLGGLQPQKIFHTMKDHYSPQQSKRMHPDPGEVFF
jgi:hypothetical protein